MSDKKRERPSPGRNLLPDFAFEQVQKNGESFYVRTDDPAYLKPTLDYGGITYRVLPPNRVSWKLPPEPLGYKDDSTLFDHVKEYLFQCYELRDVEAYDVWAGACLASWRIEDFDTCPYLCFLGPRRTGKSTALRVSKQLFYRCSGGPSVSAAWIASVIDRYSSSIVFDEAQLWKSDDKSEHLAILRGGYQKDLPRYKMISTGRGFTDIEQRIFGIKLIGCEIPVEPGIMERCIVFHTSKRTREVLRLRKPYFHLRGLQLRGELLSYRFHHLGQPVPEQIEEELEQITDDRLQELAYPILASVPLGEHENIIRFFHEQESRLRSEEETGEWADYVRAVTDCVSSSRIQPGGIILLKDFRESLMKVTETLDAKFLDSPKKNRRVLDSLAFKRAHTRDGSGFYYDKDLLKQLEDRFTPTPVEPSHPSHPSQREGSFEKLVTDVKDVKDSGGVPLPEGEAGGLTDSDHES